MANSAVFHSLVRLGLLTFTATMLGACDSSSGNGQVLNLLPQPQPPQLSALDQTLVPLIEGQGLTGDPAAGRSLPQISDPLPQLGMKLFFSKSLGGAFDSACVTCHHPMLGGGDDLSLSVGVAAIDPDLLGPGRAHVDGLPPVPRNAPTVFNAGLLDFGMFADLRVESLSPEIGANGAGTQIRTPDSAFGMPDNNAGENIPAAQARFPVTSAEEMRTDAFEHGSSGDVVRNHLAGRLGNYGAGAGELTVNNWLAEFQTAFVSAEPAATLVTYDNIARAIGEYERSMVFVNNPWNAYVRGDLTAIGDQAKRGAILFYTPASQGGAQCFLCHSGDLFSDNGHHNVAMPQIGNGKGDGIDGTSDFGRERETGNPDHRFSFRTPSLLNVAVTGPYMHAGPYGSLEQVVRHYNGPRGTVDDYFNDNDMCDLPQFSRIANCESLYPEARANSFAALDLLQQQQDTGNSLLQDINLNNNERADLVAFLRTLTDPCVEERSCLAPWIADTADSGPDDQQLNARSENGDLL